MSTSVKTQLDTFRSDAQNMSREELRDATDKLSTSLTQGLENLTNNLEGLGRIVADEGSDILDAESLTTLFYGMAKQVNALNQLSHTIQVSNYLANM